jgi:hypothetical protein
MEITQLSKSVMSYYVKNYEDRLVEETEDDIMMIKNTVINPCVNKDDIAVTLMVKERPIVENSSHNCQI